MLLVLLLIFSAHLNVYEGAQNNGHNKNNGHNGQGHNGHNGQNHNGHNGQNGNTHGKKKWYGPSYRPSWWNPNDFVGIRQEEILYEGSNTASTWPEKFSECGGSMQSPINIQTNYLERKRTRSPLTWNNYSNKPKSLVLENSKYSIHGNCVWEKVGSIPYITNGPLENRYYFSQFHFHWGSDSTKGSEHTIDGKRFPLEMHVVHDRLIDSNTPQGDNVTELVVVGYLFELSKRDNPKLNNILSRVRDIEGSTEKKTFVEPFPLDDFIHTFEGDYVTYKGSLTTPPCTEGVIWIISFTPLPVSERQLAVFRKSVRNARGITIQNFRPLQDLNERDVYYIP